MNREVYKHLLGTYGRNIEQWLGFIGVTLNVLIIRVYVVILMAQVASNLAAGDLSSAKRHTLYYLIAYIIGAAVGVLGELVSLNAENNEYGRMTIIFHDKLINKDMAFYRDHQTGYLASVFRQYLDASLLFTRFLRGEATATMLSLLVPAIVLLVAAPWIGLIASGIVVIQITYILWASSKATKYRHLSNEVYREMTAEVSDEITNIVAFKSAGVEDEAQRRIGRLRDREVRSFKLRRRTTTLLDFPRGVVTAVGISGAVYLIIAEAASGGPKALGLIVLTLTYMFQITRNVVTLPELINTHDDYVTKIYPTLSYLGEDYEAIRDPARPRRLAISRGAIDIDHISFSYPSHSKNGRRIPVFKDFSLHVKGGEQVGVVGLSGAGKSTLANLLLRFDDVQAGSISIDGTDIRQVRQSELRQKIAYVPQEPLLFHRSVRENIAYYNSKASDKDIVQAAKAAHAHGFITKLPDGYDTTVGERGVKLSGGQKQRVAIARVVLKKAPIMLFDEATSALDSESEQIIQRGLPEILGKQTAIIIAHRLSTVANLDRIIVMHEGRITESGSHAELLKLGGRYASLWRKQTTGSEA